MKVLAMDSNYYLFPESIKSIDEFVDFVNNNSQKFIKMTMLDDGKCISPYFIEEHKRVVYINFSEVGSIEEIDAEIMPEAEYRSRLREVIKCKCRDCVNYKDDPDDLSGHYERLRLDGYCWGYEKISED